MNLEIQKAFHQCLKMGIPPIWFQQNLLWKRQLRFNFHFHLKLNKMMIQY